MTLWQLIHLGGITTYILLFCSVLSIAVIFERFFYYKKRSMIKRAEFMIRIKKELEKGNLNRTLEICDFVNTPFSAVVYAGLKLHGHSDIVIANTMEREIAIETTKLERYTSIIGTIGSTAVYIGLLGTILGIMSAFRDMAAAGSGGISVTISGISEALISTAAGLLVAVPAVIAYNYFIKKIDNFITDMELCVSEVMDLITAKH